jgi:hypothetical protein
MARLTFPIMQHRIEKSIFNRTSLKSKLVVQETVRSCTTHCSQCLLPLYVSDMAADMPVMHTSKFGCPFSKELIKSFRGYTDKERDDLVTEYNVRWGILPHVL